MENKSYPIPPKILNEVRAFHAAMEKIEREEAILKRKKQVEHSKLWLLIEEAVPETAGESCRLDQEKWEVEVRKERSGGSLMDLLKNLG